MATKYLNKTNIRTYPFYKMFAHDLLFYYAIIYLFYTIVKGLSPSLVFIAEAISQTSKLLLELPCVCFLSFLGNRKGLIIANTISAISILLLMLAPSFNWIVFSIILYAFSFDIKQLCETTILFNSFPDTKKRNYLFSKYDGKAFSHYFILDAASTLLTGFLFTFNPYIPLILCFTTRCIAVLISCKFENTETTNYKQYNSQKHRNSIESLRNYFKELRNIFKFILHSKRLKCLLTYTGIFTGMLTIFITLRSLVLTDLNIPNQFFGVVLAGIQVISAISSKFVNFYQSKLKNKTLAVLAFLNAFSIIILGITLLIPWNNAIKLLILGVWLFIYAATKAPFYTLTKRYLHSFVPTDVNTIIYAFLIMFECSFGALLSLLTAFLVDNISIGTSLIIIGSILFIVFLFLLDHMKSYVGLKPEEYPKSEIIYTKLN